MISNSHDILRMSIWCSISSRILTSLTQIQILKAQKLSALEVSCGYPSYSLKVMSNHSLGWINFKCNPELGGWHNENHHCVKDTCGGCERVLPLSIAQPSRKRPWEFAFLNSEPCSGAPGDAEAILPHGAKNWRHPTAILSSYYTHKLRLQNHAWPFRS